MSLAIIMPCWLRPQRTARAIRSVVAQTRGDWRLYVIGDACPLLPEVITEFLGDPRIVFENMPTHEGRYGTQCLNRGLALASEPWVCFLGNDDYLDPRHVETRLGAADRHRDCNGFHFDAAIKWPFGTAIRPSGMWHGSTGGSEVMVPTHLARVVGFQSGDYGHDWTFIEAMTAQGVQWKHIDAPPTYIVTHLPGNLREHDID
jgi:glycosyltransferase involved in cell wall biosynthesis